jgi:hypothetical protein
MLSLLFLLCVCVLFGLLLCVRSRSLHLYHEIPSHLSVVLAMFQEAMAEQDLRERYIQVRESRRVLSMVKRIFTVELIRDRCQLEVDILDTRMRVIEETLVDHLSTTYR